MKEKAVARIREFNRFYLPAFDLLSNRYLGSEYSAGEARVLFEVYTRDGCTAAMIARTLHLDKSYLSRIIRNYESRGYLKRRVSEADSRAYELRLTEQGILRTQELIRKSNEQVGARIRGLSEEDCKRLSEAFDTVTEILKGAEHEDCSL